MPIISLIAAMDEAQGIGNQNQLLCHLPADLKHFKALTIGKPIIMGRKTFESIGKPLPNRLNIILSTQNYKQEGILVVDSIKKALEITKNVEEVMIIGGAGIYEQTITIANRIYLTRIHHTFAADVFFPAIDNNIWQLIFNEKRAKDKQNVFDISFCIYENRINTLLVKKTK